MTIAEVAEELACTRTTVLRLIRERVVPGGELLYKTDKGRERWTVDRAVFTAWLASRPRAPLLPK